jgi:hypothetical protein
MFLRRRTPLRSWSRYQQEKTLRKLNSYRRTTTMIMRKKKETTRKKKKAARVKAKMMKTTPLGDAKKEEMYRDADKIKTFGDEASDPHWQTEGFAELHCNTLIFIRIQNLSTNVFHLNKKLIGLYFMACIFLFLSHSLDFAF